MTRARELSRFTNENVFSVEAGTFNVGIGSTTPDVKLDVGGSIEATGISTFQNNLFVGAGITMLASSGIVSAVSFYGDFIGSGEGLTGVASTDNILSNAINVSGVSTFSGGVGIAESIFHLTNTGTGVSFPANNIFTIKTNENERIRVDASGNLVIKNPTSGGVYLKGIDTNGDDKILIGYESGTLVRIAEQFRVDFSAQSLEPVTDNAYDLGQADRRWRNIFSADLQLSNEGSSNDVDGTWGKYTIQEGEDDLFLINRRNGKKYKFVLQEVN